MTLWLCGQYQGSLKTGATAWDFQGIFSTKDKAISACKGWGYFIAPVFLDMELPGESVIFPNLEYPRRKGD